MTYSDNVTFFGGKGWADVRGDILVALFITTVFRNVMKVVSSDDNSSLHFRGDTNTFQNTPTNRDIASERAFFVNIISFDSSFRSFKPKANTAVVASDTFHFLPQTLGFLTNEDGVLLLERLFVLIRHAYIYNCGSFELLPAQTSLFVVGSEMKEMWCPVQVTT